MAFSAVDAFITELGILHKITIYGELASVNQSSVHAILIFLGGENQIAIFHIFGVLAVVAVYGIYV
ncbi:hypothetical protein A2727_02165 [Candidatus Nomurabacteria bacterium RIFCSPHIGHO2_01_FULL_37_110]|nr:MAG: hypothetical protein A2727_02165 [Candidatus Nomurabacteria bacterium RIFCSPHIGHO2_01_FULL_37_110]